MIADEGLALGVTTANWLDAPYNRWGFRHVAELCRTATIAAETGRCASCRAPSAISTASRSTTPAAATPSPRCSRRRSPTASSCIQDGAVVTERYFDGMRETDTHLLMSCSKSLTSILCGVLAGRGPARARATS